MASDKIIAKKEEQVSEIVDNFKNSESIVFFEYSGLSVANLTNLRRKLRENDADMKVYKNTLTKRALEKLNFDLAEHLEGPKAVAFGKDAVLPVKMLSEFKKDNPALEIKTGIVEGKIVDINVLNKLASLPSREGLLTMFAAGLISPVRNIAICIDLHRQNLENN